MATCVVGKQSEEVVVQQLKELFGNILNLDIIKSVANTCHYDVQASSNQLIELTSGYTKNPQRMERPKSFNEALLDPEKPPRSIHSVTTSSSTGSIQKKSKKAVDLERVISSINTGYKVLVLVRGMPGSGKSYLARYILERTVGLENSKLHILSTDDFFMRNGVYQYNVNQLSEAHGWNHHRAFQALSRGISPVIIDNTNTQMWEMKPYAAMATDYGYILGVLEPDTHWCFNDKELTKRNTHGVSKAQIKNMIDRYERNVTPLKLLTAYRLDYKLQKPPQLRLYPPPNIKPTVDPKNLSNKEFNNFNRFTVLNNYEETDSNGAVEVIDLMEFNDDNSSTSSLKSQSVLELSDSESSNTSPEFNTVDKILMCQDSSPSSSSNVLQPMQQCKSDVNISSSDNTQNKTMFKDIHSTWGVNEQALRSWDIVTPLNSTEVTVTSSEEKENTKEVVKVDAGTNTDDSIYLIMRKLNAGTVQDLTVLNTQNRDINRYTEPKTPGILKKLMLDKSCLTEDIYEDQEIHVEQLMSLFPNIPKTHLKYWYDKCKGDLDWTIELVLAEKEEILNVSIENDQNVEVVRLNSDDSDSNSNHSTQSDPASSRQTKGKRKSHISYSEETLELKKCIESKVNISDVHYSNHLLKVKHFKYGTTATSEEPNPGTSKAESHETDAGDVYVIDSDIEFDDIDLENSGGKEPEQSAEVMETVELNLGDRFVKQLETQFGDPNFTYPQGFQPVVQVPVSLAKQLYTFYIESVCQQMEAQKTVMETLIKEDEEFARKLQEKEHEQISKKIEKTPNLQEIMVEQIDLSRWQKEADKWKNLNPDSLAAKLTRQKLFNAFPTIDKDTLIEILHAYDNKYEDTVETLLASTTLDKVRGTPETIKEPPLSEDVIKEMREAHESSKREEAEEPHEATYYREEANKYLKKRAELYQKAQQYHQRGMTEVAQFYSGLATKQTDFYDRANNMAATAFLDEHSKRLQDFNTLDLHFLYVKEAIPALDVFLDRNINLLRLSAVKQGEYLQIITGRGKRSEHGISKLKPAVEARLKKRKINYVHLNPGLLKIKIMKTSMVTSDLE